MELQVVKMSLDATLGLLNSLTPSNSLSETESRLMLQASGSYMTLSSVTDGAAARGMVALSSPVEEFGPIFVPKRLFYLLRSYDGSMSLSFDKRKVTARCGRTSVNINLIVGDDYDNFTLEEFPEDGYEFIIPDRAKNITYPDPIPDYAALYTYGPHMVCIDGTGLIAVLTRKDGVDVPHKVAIPKKMVGSLMSIDQFSVTADADYGHLYVNSPMFRARINGVSFIQFIDTQYWNTSVNQIPQISGDCLIEPGKFVRDLAVMEQITDVAPGILVWVDGGSLCYQTEQEIGGLDGCVPCEGGEGLAIKVAPKYLSSAIRNSSYDDKIKMRMVQKAGRPPYLEIISEDDEVIERHIIIPYGMNEKEEKFLSAFRKD